MERPYRVALLARRYSVLARRPDLLQPGKGGGPLVDLMGLVGEDRVCGMYYALPEERRSLPLRDPVWAFYIQRLDDEAMSAAFAWVETLLTTSSPTQIPVGAAADVEFGRFTAQLTRRSLGLSYEMNEREEQMARASDRIVDGVMARIAG